MTTAEDVIAARIVRLFQVSEDDASFVAFGVLADLLSAPDSVRLELAAQLNPWRAIETAQKDSDESILLGCFNETGADMMFVGYFDEGAPNCGPDHVWHVEDASIVYHRNLPTHWLPLPAPPSEDKS